MTKAPCPFRSCQVSVDLVPTIPAGQPGHANSMVYRRHRVEPDDWFGTCPASVLGFPLLPHESEMLREQAEVFDRVKAARERKIAEARDPNVRPTPQPEHPLTPHPFPSSGFNSSTAPWPKNVIPIRKRGDGVATTAEVQAAIRAANQVLEEAAGLAQAAAEKFREAQAMMAAITQQTGAELGRRPAEGAVIDCDSAAMQAQAAIETNDHYASMM